VPRGSERVLPGGQTSPVFLPHLPLPHFPTEGVVSSWTLHLLELCILTSTKKKTLQKRRRTTTTAQTPSSIASTWPSISAGGARRCNKPSPPGTVLVLSTNRATVRALCRSAHPPPTQAQHTFGEPPLRPRPDHSLILAIASEPSYLCRPRLLSPSLDGPFATTSPQRAISQSPRRLHPRQVKCSGNRAAANGGAGPTDLECGFPDPPLEHVALLSLQHRDIDISRPSADFPPPVFAVACTCTCLCTQSGNAARNDPTTRVCHHGGTYSYSDLDLDS
jgi:hypothetical protein